jgi:Smg protein
MTFRVLGPHERGRFAPDAWGHLLSLSDSGAISAPELEHVIERAMTQLDGRIALDDLRTLMEGAGFAGANSGVSATVH